MAGLIKLLAVKKRDVDTGLIKSRLADGRYSVNVHGRSVRATSAISGDLVPNDRVVVADSAEGPSIIGKEDAVSRDITEVVVDG